MIGRIALRRAQQAERIVQCLLLALVYLAAGKFSLFLAAPLQYASIAFFPAGIALAAVYCRGRGIAPGVLLGSLLLNLSAGWDGQGLTPASVLLALAIAAASTLQALLGAALLRRVVGNALSLIDDREILRFLLLIPVICLVSASLSLPALLLAGAEQSMSATGLWLVWWAGDAIGVLIAAPVTLSLIARPRELWRSRRRTLVWPVMVAVAAVVSVSLRVGELERKELQDRFQLRAQEAGTLFQVGLNSQQLVQDSVAQLFVSSEHVSREEFRDFVRWATARNPNIQVVEWLPRVTREQRGAFEAEQRAYFGGRFGITDILPGNRLVRAAERDEYFPITYLEPEAGNERAIGFDPTSSAVSRAAIEEAFRRGSAYARPPLMMVREHSRQHVLMLYRPVFRAADGRYTLDRAAGEVAGMINIALRTEDFVRHLLGPAELKDFALNWVDVATGDSYLGRRTDDAAPFRHQVDIAVAGRDMRLVFTPSALFLHNNRTHQALLLMLAGLLVAGLFGVFMLSISGQTLRIANEVRQRTRDLGAATERAVASEQRTRDMLQEVREAEARLRQAAAAFGAASEGIVITDAEYRVVAVNAAYCQITGYSEEEVLGRTPAMLVGGSEDEEFFLRLTDSLTRYGVWRGEISSRRKHGDVFCAWLSITVVRDEQERLVNFVAVFSDISKQKAAQQTIQHQANYDMLTGLPNRRLFNDRLEQEIRRCIRDRSALALMFLDLDHFKDINDTLGHHVGDLLLRQMARRIQDCLRETDTVARLGGDEFTIILAAPGERRDVEHIARQLIEAVQQPLAAGDEVIRISTSIGITFYPADADSAAVLIQNADRAMYAAKEAGRCTFSFYSAELESSWASRRLIKSELERALEARELVVYYQPVLHARNGGLLRAEALVRWQHPARGLLLPADFLPMAERMGLIDQIDDYVFIEVCRQIRQWQHQGLGDVHVCINRSARRMDRQSARLDWVEYLHQQAIDCRQITLEITESVLMEVRAENHRFLQRLRAAGVGISIDDFGTGYSSLAYLKRLEVDYLKIDKAFVHDLERDDDDRAIVEALIVMAGRLDIQVVAEGVETASQKAILEALGCDWMQGYHFAAPMPAEAFTRYLAGRRAPALP